MQNKKKLAAPCGLYCGVCGVYIAHRDDNIKFKDRLAGVYGVARTRLSARGVSLINHLCTVRPAPSEIAQIRKVLKDVTNAMIFPANLLRISPFLSGKK
jgi:hypothetical protein